MPDILLLGAGFVARPLVRYMLERGHRLTVATDNPDDAADMVQGHPSGQVVSWTAGQADALDRLAQRHDLAVSLLPATLHLDVARACLKNRTPMVTTSYVSDEMRALHREARAVGVTLLNETGVDPGIDHMSALRVIHDVHRRGGRVTAFRSYCGGLPAPESDDNPWHYKFSWSPLAVLNACTAGSRYIKNGELVEVPSERVFLDVHRVTFDDVGALEAYPNRDATQYIDLYGLDGIDTMFRGTLRYPGWCHTLQRVKELGLLDDETPCDSGATWAAAMARLVGEQPADPDGVRRRAAAHLWLEPDDHALACMDWLGLFSDDDLPVDRGTLRRQLAARMASTMAYGQGERDMIVMHHEFVADFGDRRQRLTSTMHQIGVPDGDSAMARTVALPAAAAAHLLVQGKIATKGVIIPTAPEVYEPILDELATQGITLHEQVHPL